MIVYANMNDLFLAKSDGAEPHKLVSAPDPVRIIRLVARRHGDSI